MSQYKFDVVMSCSGCSGAITRTLSKQDGIEKFEVSLENQKVIVESSTLTEDDIMAAIRKTGKSVKVASE
ncbi:ATX1 antioxidant protein 1 [Modicella reniformis]|uniref:ATX1 antioxidant protein 1 n=1 Tax=Modicella reniformis TaxID=1440133 RepID=A0A9P6J8Q0_9FUNG|nr:ATX1 antioxidant protein 1 [Modicella reniformis]